MAYKKDFPVKDGLIGLKEAADYLNCSHQTLSRILNDDEADHPLREHFRYYAGAWRTTYALLDEFFTTGQITYQRKGELPNDNDKSDN